MESGTGRELPCTIGRRSAFGLLAAVALLLAGCGGGGNGQEPDTTPPQITGGPVAEVWGDSVEIAWTTDEVANSTVRYGLDDTLSQVTTDARLLVEHSVWLRGLVLDTTYAYTAESTDPHGNGPTTSAIQTFFTAPNPIQLTDEGWARFEDGDAEEALSAFERALDLDSLYAEAWSGCGWAHLRSGEREEARSKFERCLALDAAQWDASVGLAVVLASLGDKESSVPLCLAVLGALGDAYQFEHDTSVTSADLRVLLAGSYVHLLELDLALEQVQILNPEVLLDPEDPETWGESPTFAAALLAEIEVLALSFGT